MTPKKFVPDTKLSSKLLIFDSSNEIEIRPPWYRYFSIFWYSGLCTQIFYSWMRLDKRWSESFFKTFDYMPDTESILATTSKRYENFEYLIEKTDCLKIFFEISQNLEATWSDNKQQSTVKFRAWVIPNSAITVLKKLHS